MELKSISIDFNGAENLDLPDGVEAAPIYPISLTLADSGREMRLEGWVTATSVEGPREIAAFTVAPSRRRQNEAT